VAHFPAVVALHNQSGQDQAPQVLTGRLHFNLQLVADLADAEFGTVTQKFEDFDTAVVGEALHYALEPLGSGPLRTDNAL
jgi:hypothetical protein